MTGAGGDRWGGTGDLLEVSRDTGQRSQDGTAFQNLRSIYMDGVRAQGSHGGWGQCKKGFGGTPICAPRPSAPSRSPASSPGPARRERRGATCVGRHPPAAPACVWRRGRGTEAQVARLSAGRPDMRIWELLLLRMESWVPPFTPLLARDGCRCLKSTAK